MIKNWDQYLDAWYEKDEDGVLGINRDLRPSMTLQFCREYDRTMARVLRENTVYAYSRRYVQVVTRKYKARKRRKR